ncbi:hypothetical protein D3C71_1550780 [compost metagenome]
MAFGVFFEPHVQVRGQAQSNGLGGHQGDIAVDHAAVFQSLDAAQHGAGGQAHLLADDVIGFTAVFLKTAQDGPIQLVQCVETTHGAGFYENPRTCSSP